MLKIIDSYIIKKYLITFFFMLGVIMILAMVFDLAERLGEFIEKEAPVRAIIFDYYLNFVVYFGNLFSPLIVFVRSEEHTSELQSRPHLVCRLLLEKKKKKKK